MTGDDSAETRTATEGGRPTNGPATASLEIDGISKRYGDTVAVDRLSFDVRAGELFGFVGRNGAGKTTTMRIVLGVLGGDGGEVRWAGRPLDLAMRRRIGYMPEERGLYPKMRLAEQLAYIGELHGMPGRDASAAGLQWLERFGLADRAKDELQTLSLGNQHGIYPAVGPLVIVGSAAAGFEAALGHRGWSALAIAVVALGAFAAYAGPIDVWGVVAVGFSLLLVARAASLIRPSRGQA